MKKQILTFLLLTLLSVGYCQNADNISTLNFDFEKLEKGQPMGWINYGNSNNYRTGLDSITKIKGKYAATIEFNSGAADFKAWSFAIPDNYAGKKITLTGYIKTENVIEGYAGLWMRIDPQVAFDNMDKNGIKGTTDWTKYSITLNMNPEKTKQIVVGGLLVGKGKMWLDNLSVSIDGKDISELKPFEKKLFPANKDKEFDKGSEITNITVDKNNIENLKILGLIWGFLKYHHPIIAKGDFNWDYELFRMLPKILKATNKNERDDILTNWVTGLGAFSEGKELSVKASDIKMEPDLDWISHSGFSSELMNKLLAIKNAERPKEHYYIGLFPSVGNPEFKNEEAYADMKYPDLGYRILTLYRYWNIIQYYYPYKYLLESDWKNVLETFIPKMVDARNEKDYTLTVLELIGQINDTHANIWSNNQSISNFLGVRYAAVELSFIENKAVVTGFYDEKAKKEMGLEMGDIISTINDKPVEAIVKDLLKYSPASNYATKLRDIAPKLLRTNDSSINIQYFRNNVVGTKTLKTYSTREINIYSKYMVRDTCFKLIDKDIAYINNGSLKKKYLPEIWKAIENTKGLIIDIRNYPSDFPIYDLSNYLMPNRSPFVKFTNGNLQQPGLFSFTKTLSTGKRNKDSYKGKLVILINEITQSSAEFHTMAYRINPNATVIGSTTAGADGNVSQFYLPGGISTMITGIGVYYPDGKETQRIGIVPDIEIRPTIQGIKKGQDELMLKAIEIIRGQ